jgi:hypothetical protein
MTIQDRPAYSRLSVDRVPKGTQAKLSSLMMRIEQLEGFQISFHSEHKRALARVIRFLKENQIEGQS